MTWRWLRLTNYVSCLGGLSFEHLNVEERGTWVHRSSLVLDGGFCEMKLDDDEDDFQLT